MIFNVANNNVSLKLKEKICLILRIRDVKYYVLVSMGGVTLVQIGQTRGPGKMDNKMDSELR